MPTEIKVPLTRFVSHLNETKGKQPSRPFNLDEIAFLMESFQFDDSSATYAPQQLENDDGERDPASAGKR